MKLTTVVLALLMVLVGTPADAGTSRHGALPVQIDLPSGFFPEGIAAGRGATFYVSSLDDGSIWKGNFRTGDVEPLADPTGGFTTVGLFVDNRGRVWAAGGPSGAARVYNGRTGELLATYQFTAPFESFINDVVIDGEYAWFTDSGTQNSPNPDAFQFAGKPRLFRVPVGRRLAAPDDFSELEVAIPDVSFPNLNGIETTPNGRRLLVAHSELSAIFNVNPRSGAAVQVEIDQTFEGADGLRRDGRKLYIANGGNVITELRLNRRGTVGRYQRTLVAQGAEITTTIAIFADGLYLPDARFFSQSDPYRIYRVPLSCRRIHATGEGEGAPPRPGDPPELIRTQARVFDSPLRGTTEAAFTFTDPTPPVATFGGELTFFTRKFGTLTVLWEDATQDLVTGRFHGVTPVIDSTGPLTGAYGTIEFDGILDLEDPAGSFTETLTGEVCSDAFR